MSFSSPSSSLPNSRSVRIPSPPPPLFPISSLSPLAPLINAANNGVIDVSANRSYNHPLPAPVFLDLEHEVNRSVLAMPAMSNMNDFGAYSVNRFEPFTNQKTSTKTDLFSASPLLKESVVDAPAMPDYYDRMTSFYSTMSSANEILSSIDLLFQQNLIDHKIKANKKEIKGLAYVNEHPIHFRVFVFYVAPSKYLIEFQKRDGCCFAYRQLYKSLLKQMSHQLCDEECVKDVPVNPISSGSLSLAPLSLKDSRQETFNHCSSKLGTLSLSFLDNDSLGTLLTMAQADCLQSQREALRALSSSSALDGDHACSAVNASAGQTTKFFSALNAIIVNSVDADQELVRCSLTFLNNLLDKKTKEAASIRTLLFSGSHMDAQRLVNKILSLLDDPIHLSDELTMAEIKRQCARFIAILAQSNVNEIKPLLDSTAISIINRYENCEDRRLRGHIIAAKAALAK